MSFSQKSLIGVIETYLLTGMRHPEMNPVRAALADHPAHYRWTRYRGQRLWAVITATTLIESIIGRGRTRYVWG
ncbi:MAG: hypothetical protein ACREYF_20415 [Gammaproteobacteria bacterium]